MDERAGRPGRDGSVELDGEVVVEGVHADMPWQVRVHDDEDDLCSMLYLHRGDQFLDGSGMSGPPLTPGELFTAMSGYTDHSPATALVHPPTSSQ